MATFIKIDETAGVLVLAAVVIGVWFMIAPDHATETVVGLKESILGVVN
jgi:hypothetical protein